MDNFVKLGTTGTYLTYVMELDLFEDSVQIFKEIYPLQVEFLISYVTTGSQ